MKHLALLLLASTFLSNPNSHAQTAKSTSMIMLEQDYSVIARTGV